MCLVLPFVLVVLAPARAGSKNIDTVYFDGQVAFGNHGVGIPPYGGTLNGTADGILLRGFHARHHRQYDLVRRRDEFELSESAFDSTRLKNKDEYLEMAWLITQMESLSIHR